VIKSFLTFFAIVRAALAAIIAAKAAPTIVKKLFCSTTYKLVPAMRKDEI
jgi:hypothetical protein